MGDVTTERFKSFDGVELAIHKQGAGRPVILLHGLFSSAEMNWTKFGHAQTLADAGFEAIMPDLRAHGQSAAPHAAEFYPPDVLVADVRALVEQLGHSEYDLAGFSLGARVAVHAAIAGLTPRRLVIAGMGLEGLGGWDGRATFFLDAIERFDAVKEGDPAFFAVQFMKTMKTDRVAARLLLQSIDDGESPALGKVTIPTLVLCGDLDRDNGSPEALAQALPNAQLQFIPGSHMGSVTGPELGNAIAKFLVE